MGSLAFISAFLCFGIVWSQTTNSFRAECNPVRWGLKGELHVQTIDIPNSCEKGRIEYHHSDGELELRFSQTGPFHVCIRQSKQLMVMDDTRTRVTGVRNYMCVHQVNPRGGDLSLFIKPNSHYYVCYVEYVMFPYTTL